MARPSEPSPRAHSATNAGSTARSSLRSTMASRSPAACRNRRASIRREFSRVAGGEAVRILDARDDRRVFDAAHVAGAIHAPLRSAFFSATAGSYLAESDSILLVLEKAEDVDLAVRQLYRIGFDHVLGWITAEEAKAAGLSAERRGAD